jgi:hypothetical protein
VEKNKKERKKKKEGTFHREYIEVSNQIKSNKFILPTQ